MRVHRILPVSLLPAVLGAVLLTGCSSNSGGAASTSSPTSSTSSSPAATVQTSTSTSSAVTSASAPASTGTSAGPTSSSSSTPASGMSGMSGMSTGSSSTSGTATAATGTDVKAACAALVGIDATPQPQSDSDAPPAAAEVKKFASTVKPLIDVAIAKGDATLGTALTYAKTAVDKAVTTGTLNDPSQDPKLGASLLGYETWAHRHCGFTTIDMMAMDYKYTGQPTSVKAGVVSLILTNESKKGEFHVALFVQPKNGKKTTVAQLLKTPVQQLEGSVNILGAADAAPGGAGGTLLTLKPGQYFVVCPVAVGNKPNSTDLHMFHGMAIELDVT